MPVGRLRKPRSLNHQEENATLLENFLENLEIANRSPHTIAANLVGVMTTSPAALIQHRRIPVAVPRWLNPIQIKQLLAAADKQRDYALVDFMWSSGCRVSEVVAARVEYVQWKERVVKVLGKGQKGRLVPLGPKTVKSLRVYLQGRKTGSIFLTVR
jgi:site-specific recombinase XerD